MYNRIVPSVSHPTIADIYQDIRSKKLILQPDFQRKFVWTNKHRESFIDTILQGYPFPEIYVCQGSIDMENLTTTKNVIDGQQRLTTILRYINPEEDDIIFQDIPTYEALDENSKRNFLSYTIVVRDLGNIDDTTIREVFKRINLTKFKLEDIEIQNAIYDGEFITTAKDISNSNNIDIFHESELLRMSDLHFILLVMSTIENDGYFAKDSKTESYIIKYNEYYPNKDIIKDRINSTIQLIDSLNLDDDSIWFRKSNYFTLVIELIKSSNINIDNLKQRLLKFEEDILNNKREKNEYGQYYSYMYTGTNARKSRVERAEIFKRHIF